MNREPRSTMKAIFDINKTVFAVVLCGLMFAQGVFQQVEASENLNLPEHIKAIADSRFENGYPTKEAARMLEDEIFFQRAVQVYLWALPAMNMTA